MKCILWSCRSCVLALILSGCGTVYVNEADRNLDAAARSSVTVESSVDRAYRRIYSRFQSCLSSYGYRIRGTINQDRNAASIVVDSGIGFDRVLYLADSVFLHANLDSLSPERTRVTFVSSTDNARPFADAAGRWLVSGEGPCRS